MAEIIHIADHLAPLVESGASGDGNGAHAALIDIAQSLPNRTGRNDATAWADWLLIELFARGFIVKPRNSRWPIS